MLPAVAVDHVGIVAPEAAGQPLVDALGGVGPLVEMPSGVAISRFGPDTMLELVTPVRSGSPVEAFLERRGPGLHHVAFRVDEPLAAVLEQLHAFGIESVGEIVPSSDGRPSVFLHPKTTGGVLVELVQGPRP